MARFYRKGKVRYFMSIIKHRKLRYQADILPLEPIGGTALVSAQNNTEIGRDKNFDYPEKPLKYKHIRRISD